LPTRSKAVKQNIRAKRLEYSLRRMFLNEKFNEGLSHLEKSGKKKRR
jgi:hypothetical protein